MTSSTVQMPPNKEHSYVILNQQRKEEPQLSLIVEAPEEEDESLEVNPNSSDSSLGTNKTGLGLLSKSNYSDLTLKLLSALFYGLCSFLITVINKIVLTTYKFPSSNILGVGQAITIIIFIKIASQFHLVTIRKVSMRNKKMWILAGLYLGNVMSGLGGTKHLPLPMFIALRRFSIAMTAIGEFYLLRVKQTFSIIMTIVAMIGGSLIAAASDLTFDALGYFLVMTNNLFSAANGVYIKKTMDSKEISKQEILFYNALFSVLPLILICLCTNNMETLYNYEHWTELGFIISFLMSCAMGYLLLFSTILCTHYNSALTTTIVGTIKVSFIICKLQNLFQDSD